MLINQLFHLRKLIYAQNKGRITNYKRLPVKAEGGSVLDRGRKAVGIIIVKETRDKRQAGVVNFGSHVTWDFISVCSICVSVAHECVYICVCSLPSPMPVKARGQLPASSSITSHLTFGTEYLIKPGVH